MSTPPSTWVPTADSFGARLLLLRYHLGLTMQQAADQAGLSRATWRTWEAGAYPRNAPHVVDSIAHAFQVDRDWLMWGGSESAHAGSSKTAFSPFCPGVSPAVAELIAA